MKCCLDPQIWRILCGRYDEASAAVKGPEFLDFMSDCWSLNTSF